MAGSDHRPQRREDERSLWLNIAVAAKLVRDPKGVVAAAKVRLERLRAEHPRSGPYLDQWEQALTEGPHAVLAFMTERSERGQVLRSASPVTGLGLLSAEERRAVLAAFNTWWRGRDGCR